MRIFGGLGLVLALTVGASACATSTDGTEGEDGALALGDIEGDALAGSDWGSAEECKELLPPNPLKSPAIVMSIDGLTIHLWDREGDYDKVFPVGAGAIENGKSLTILGNFNADLRAPAAVDGTYGQHYGCRVWWTDTDASTAESTVRRPVFAGLPFIRFSGAYAFHGPIDNFNSTTGGTLRRGYVSHGCGRMSVEGIKELYSRIVGKRVPVKVQQEVERRADGSVVDVAAAFIGSECSVDADCSYSGGRCLQMVAGARRTCTKACTSRCPDAAGRPVTFCQRLSDAGGYCVPQSNAVTNGACMSYRGRLGIVQGASNGSRSEEVCGAVGDPGAR